MARAKKITDRLLLIALGLLPFGQLPGLWVQDVMDLPFRVHPIDLVVGLVVVVNFPFRARKLLGWLMPLAGVIVLGQLLNYNAFFDPKGLFYALRLLVYFGLFALTFKESSKILPAFLVIGIAVSLVGLVQYAIFPDLTSLKSVGWDDHYYRLVSTFLDPAFTGIILALSAIACIYLYVSKKGRLYLLPFSLIFISLLLTYSRAGIVSFFLGVAFLLFRKNKALLALIFVTTFLSILVLPRSPGGEGVKLERTNSVVQKVENFKEGTGIFLYSPVFGVGYNNICRAKELVSADVGRQENSCFGLDNSLLLILSTMGVLGLFVYLDMFFKLFQDGNALFRSSFVAVFLHSMFTNTLFYPWVLLWLAILASANRRSEE